MRIQIILLLLILSACDYYDNKLHVINDSNQPVTVETYTDTIPDFPSINKTEFYLSEKIFPRDTMRLTSIGKNGWHLMIERSKNKKLNLVVFSIDSVKKYHAIDTLIRRHIYKRYEFSEEELKYNKWNVTIN